MSKIRRGILLALMVLGLTFVAYTLILIFVEFPVSPAGDISTRAAVGDAFSPLGVLFSGLGLAAVALTIYLQLLELEDQRRQLRSQQDIALLTTYLAALSLSYDPPPNVSTPGDLPGSESAKQRREEFFKILDRALDYLGTRVAKMMSESYQGPEWVQRSESDPPNG